MIPAVVFAVLVVAQLLQLPVVTNGHRYGTKTPYATTPTNWATLARDTQLPESCRLVHARVIARHGTRSYDAGKVETTNAAVKKIIAATVPSVNVYSLDKENSSLTLDQLIRIRSWKNKFIGEMGLLERGKNEHRFLAEDYFRLLNSSSSHLDNNVSTFNFESSSVARAKDSAIAFQQRWDDLTGRNSSSEPINVNDTRLYFHKNCPAYVKHVLLNPAAYAERYQAGNTTEGADLVEKINKNRLLLAENVLSFEDIFALYDTAAFEAAAFNSSVFEALFDVDDEAFLEYIDDLQEYWVGSYGAQLTAEMSCVLLNDIFETADEAFRANSSSSGVSGGFGFTHFEMLKPIYSALGLCHDPQTAFTANASRFFFTNRQFDTSKIGKFASNVAFLFYDCPSSLPSWDQVLLVTVNGEPQPLPLACPYTLPCPVAHVKKAYPLATGFPQKCDFQKMCSLTTNNGEFEPVKVNSGVKTTQLVPLLITNLMFYYLFLIAFFKFE